MINHEEGPGLFKLILNLTELAAYYLEEFKLKKRLKVIPSASTIYRYSSLVFLVLKDTLIYAFSSTIEISREEN